MTSILLDTNTFSSYIDYDKKVINAILKSNKVFLSVISSGELIAGFLKGSMFSINNARLNRFLRSSKVQLLDINKNTSEIYGKIYFDLQKVGKPIPTNDMWIAACAIETNSTLITYDKHFLKIPNLKLWSGIK